ncbi:MAG TPA: macro domain-containing protein [Pyrinomonadaceae bacterium]|nr:macro domain-containing protein [Pyrinomonadaceae bacterium]
MIKFVSGDILRTTAKYIAHGVATGTQEGLGTGLALKISSKWPDAQKHFKQFTRGNKFQGGDLFVVAPARNRPGIIYLATQPDMYQASLSFLNRGLRKLERYCVKRDIESVALPRIGAGLGKLDWETETKPLMMKFLENGETLFYIYEDFTNEYEDQPDRRDKPTTRTPG